MDWLSELLISPDLPAWWLLLILFALMAIPMGPAEPTALTAGVLVCAPVLSPSAAVLVIAAGMTLGDVLTHRASSPLLRMLRQKPAAAQRLDRWSQRLQSRPLCRDAAVAGLRFLPGARTPAVLAARAAGMTSARLMLLAGAGSLAWATLWVLGGGTLVHLLPGWVVIAALLSVMLVAIALRSARHRWPPAGRQALPAPASQ